MKRNIFLLQLLVIIIFGMHFGLHGKVSAKEEKRGSQISEFTVSGFVHPESVAFDPGERVLYVGQFGSKLEPTLKDGKGKISKVSLSGKIIKEKYLPASGNILHKPKGIWIEGSRLWVTDIDVVWIFDLSSRRGRKVSLPDATFANDPTVMNNVLYVSDSNEKRIYKVEPADFFDESINPFVTDFAVNLPFGPNGLYPAKNGSLLSVGFEMNGQSRGIYSFKQNGKYKALSKEIGMLDGVVQLIDGSLLLTDWKSKTLSMWNADSGAETLSAGFAGPADFCVINRDNNRLLVVVPDLVKNELRLINISR